MNTNTLPSERVAVLGAIDPDAYTAAAYSTDYIPLKLWNRIQAIVMAGDLGSSATLDAKITAYTSGAGAGAVDVSGAAITQLTQAGTDSNKQAVINLDVGKLISAAFTHVRLTMTVGVATSDAGAIVLGFDPKYPPASDNDATTVDSIASA